MQVVPSFVPLHILTIADGRYFKRVLALISSIKQHMPDVPVILKAFDFSLDQKLLVEETNPNCQVIASFVSPHLSSRERFNELICHRVEVIKDMTIRGEQGRILWMDADTLIVNNASELRKTVMTSDIAVRFRPWKGENERVQAGVFGINLARRDLIDEFYRLYVERRCYIDGYVDQYALWAVAEKMRDQITITDLPRRYNDDEMGRESIVWHCKHHTQNTKPYQEKVEQIYRAAKEGSLYFSSR